MPIETIIAGAIAKEVGGRLLSAGGKLVKRLVNPQSSRGLFETGSDIEILSNVEAAAAGISTNGVCPPGFHVAVDKCSGAIVCKKTRRRRKRMLSCSDKVDISFITGTLGKGQMAQAAIAALIAKC